VWAITVRLRQIVGAVAGQGGDFLVAHNLLEQEIAKLEGVTGVCERILSSPIPPTYSRHLSRVLTIWLAMLPIGLIGSGIPIVGTIFASAFTSYILVGIDEIGMEIEHPFSLLPMQQLAAAAQKGVGMQLMDHECSEGSIEDVILSQMPQVPL
jgi:predicted membrane chloride channel (bestrophin family)